MSRDKCRIIVASAAFCALAQSAAHAQALADADLSGLSIEQLTNVEVTSVSKRPESLSAAPASIFVITADDIRRSGATNLPEALRMAPNLEVARLNGFAYTVTARGFNSPESADKLQVLIDGRSVYSPLASTVFWENLDVPLSDIERIEVISGPGGTLYGANAMNGVINIVTKNSASMQGLHFDGGLGTLDSNATLSYGAKLSDTASLQLYADGFHSDDTDPVSAADTSRTAWQGFQTGFRFDQAGAEDVLNLEGNLYSNGTPNMTLETGHGGSIQGAWTHQLEDGSSIAAQLSYDNSLRIQPGLKDELQASDFQIQQNTSLGLNDAFVWGGEYRLWYEAIYTPGFDYFAKPATTLTLGNIFAQEELPLGGGLRLTAGLKIEDNSYSGLDFMPDVRLSWQMSDKALFWGAISRAVRTPSKIDREFQAPGLVLPSPDFQSEKVTAFELGYRGEIAQRLSLSASLYYNLYDDLRSDELAAGGVFPLMLDNGIRGSTYGAELWGNYSVADWWRLGAGFDWLHKDLSLKPGHTDFSLGQSEGQDPAYQAQLRSQMNFLGKGEFDVTLRGIDKVTRAFTPGPVTLVPGYVEADARIGWQLLPSLALSLNGYNLLHARHLEVNDPSTYPPQYIERSFLLSLRKSF
ncbi:MAG TPA: TonB-dependent receptor [Rhizomicrobium sp.]